MGARMGVFEPRVEELQHVLLLLFLLSAVFLAHQR